MKKILFFWIRFGNPSSESKIWPYPKPYPKYPKKYPKYPKPYPKPYPKHRIQNPKTVSKIQNCRIQKYPKLKTPYPKIFKNIQKYPKPYSKFHRIQNRIPN